MKEAEIVFPVTCPICLQESLAGFRMSVVVDALQAEQIRLYANCHATGWEASNAELEQIREYLDAGDHSVEHENLAFIHTGVLESADEKPQLRKFR